MEKPNEQSRPTKAESARSSYAGKPQALRTRSINSHTMEGVTPRIPPSEVFPDSMEFVRRVTNKGMEETDWCQRAI